MKTYQIKAESVCNLIAAMEQFSKVSNLSLEGIAQAFGEDSPMESEHLEAEDAYVDKLSLLLGRALWNEIGMHTGNIIAE